MPHIWRFKQIEPALKALRFYMRHGRTKDGETVLLAANERSFALPDRQP